MRETGEGLLFLECFYDCMYRNMNVTYSSWERHKCTVG